jgi:hypothetical protein
LRAVRFKSELKVLLVAALCVIAVESVVWLCPTNAQIYARSLDAAFRATARRLEAFKQDPRILVMGNSLAISGVNQDLVSSELGWWRKRPPAVFSATMAGSAATEWYYIFRNYFSHPSARPDLLVLCLIEHFIHDDLPLELDHLPAICPLGDYPLLARADLRRFDDRVELALHFMLPAFRYRSSVRHAVLGGLIPGYEKNLQRLNNAGGEPKAGPGGAAFKTVEKYARLRRLLKLIKQSHVPALIVAMPLRDDKIPMDPEAVRLIRAAGVRFEDCGAMAGLSLGKYRDFLHLNEAGALIFTHQLDVLLLKHFPGRLIDPQAFTNEGVKKKNEVSSTPSARTAMRVNAGP